MRSRIELVACLVLLLSAGDAYAQAADGRVSGTVRAASGAVIPSARVTATHSATHASRSAQTAADGSYILTGLANGTYTVAVAAVGYRRASRDGVLVPGAAPVDFALEVLPLRAVTVTATLREQELRDVPFSVAAPTASVLRERGAENLEAIAANVAGLSVQNLGPGQSQVALRGASSGQIARDQPGVKESVGAYLDDTPISLSLFTPDMDLFDVSRVEVLRGPQGTLFGAGSLSGTVRYISNQPELGVKSEFGETGAHMVNGGSAGATVKAGMNVPLGERGAFRLAAFQNRMGGWQDAVRKNYSVDQDVNDGQRNGMRLAVKYAPNERLTITPRLVYQQVRMSGWSRTDSFNILANPYTTTRPAVTLGGRRLFLANDEPYSDEFVLSDLRVQYDFGGVSLTSITSHMWRDIVVTRDGGALYASIVGGSIGMPEPVYSLDAPFDDRTNVRVLTQEVRLAGSRGDTRWLLGAFYSRADRDYGQSVYTPGFTAATGAPTAGARAREDELYFSDLAYDLRQMAAFGEGTITIGRRLDLTGGVRLYKFEEDRDQVFDGFFVGYVSQPGKTDASGAVPRAIANYRVTDDLSVNAQVSRGFRLGGINDPINVPICTPQDLATFGGRDSWKDETAWNYELGTKASLMGGRASLNASAYYMDISDLQLTVTAGSCSSRLIYNVPAVSRGLELEFAAAPITNFDFALSVSLNDSEVRETVLSGGDVVAGIERGNRLPSVPKVQTAIAANYRWPLRGGAQGFISGSVHHTGDRYTLMEDVPLGDQATLDLTTFEGESGQTIGEPLSQNSMTYTPKMPAYTLANVRIGVTRGNWETALYINNLTDARALLAMDRERGARARVGYLVNQPRTVGLRMTFTY